MIGNILSPAVSLNLIRSEVSKKLGKKVNQYKILYNDGKKPFNLFFIVDNITHPFNDEGKISTIIKEQLKGKIDNKNIDAFIIDYEKPEQEKPNINVKIFFTDDNGDKKFIDSKL